MSDKVVSKQEIIGTSFGVFFMAFFGTAWAGIGIGGLQDWISIWLITFIVFIGIILLIGFLYLVLASRKIPGTINKKHSMHGKRMGIGFGITFGLEGILIALASIICNAVNHFEYFFPIMALIVGVHFFPLAHLFRVRVHYMAGALLCILSIITLLFLPRFILIDHHQILLWWVVLGFGSALVLWGTGLKIWLLAYALLKNA